MQAMSSQPQYLGEFEHVLLLAILQCGDEAYTVPVRQLLAGRIGRSVSRGAIHTCLDRLEAKGFVRSHLGEPVAVRGGRSRRYYVVTRDGLEAIRTARTALQTLSTGLERLLDRDRR
jgi:DNA-binding PadR family transcriptional regulator